MKKVLHLGIAHVVGDLKQMDPEHQLKRERLPGRGGLTRVEGLNQCKKV